MKRISSLILLTILAASMVSCKDGGKKQEKTKALWICCDANLERLSSRDSICFYLDKARESGFNQVVVDVKGAEGYVLYKSDFIPTLTTHGNVTVPQRDWDYLEYFITQAHERGMSVMVSATAFAVGSPGRRTGPIYDNPELGKYTCLEYTPDGMMKIENDHRKVSAFLNPVLPESQEYGLRTFREIFSRYDFDAFCLDYCRYPDAQSDFSEASRTAFEQYLGQDVERWPEDVFEYDSNGSMVPGKFYKQWWTFRALTIKNFIARVRDLRDELQPDVKLEYWAASWLHALNVNGQNWASSQSDFYKDLPWASEDYNKAAFAELLDVFITGTYLERVWGMDDLESIEYGLYRSNRDIAGACELHGSLCAPNHKDQFDDACYLCLRETGGLMVFDLVHIVNHNLWDKIKAGIDRYENEF